MAGAGSEPENLSGKYLTMLLPSFQSHENVQCCNHKYNSTQLIFLPVTEDLQGT